MLFVLTTFAAPPTCQPLATADTRSVRLLSQGSRAYSLTDLTLDLAGARLSGDVFEADEPLSTEVDTKVAPEAVKAVRDALAAICAVPEPFEVDQIQAPGGFTALEVTPAEGKPYWVTAGPASIAAPGRLAKVDREAFQKVVEAWPVP